MVHSYLTLPSLQRIPEKLGFLVDVENDADELLSDAHFWHWKNVHQQNVEYKRGNMIKILLAT